MRAVRNPILAVPDLTIDSLAQDLGFQDSGFQSPRVSGFWVLWS